MSPAKLTCMLAPNDWSIWMKVFIVGQAFAVASKLYSTWWKHIMQKKPRRIKRKMPSHPCYMKRIQWRSMWMIFSVHGDISNNINHQHIIFCTYMAMTGWPMFGLFFNKITEVAAKCLNKWFCCCTISNYVLKSLSITSKN